MITKIGSLSLLLGATVAFSSCSKDDPETQVQQNTIGKFRQPVSYTSFTDSTAYKAAFVVSNDTIVDLAEGNDRFNMLRALDAYNKSVNPVAVTTSLDENKLKNMFSNTSAPFTDTYAYLNASSVQIRNKVAGSVAETDAVRTKIESYFTKIATASQSNAMTAAEGQAGKIKTNAATPSYYLVDQNGVEWAQVIAKSLIGALQLDYICNTLLSEPALSADNTTLLAGKKVSQLEYNWDQAYANLTIKPVFLGASTATSNGGESFIGSYVWEYNKEGYKKIHPAFLKGRAAIINGDKAVLTEQANIIRREFEKAIGAAAAGYMQKVKDAGTDNGVRAHAYGEGAGFLYSIRFCKLNGCDAAFSDGLLNDVEFNSTGIWQLTAAEAEAAINKIKAKFGL